MANPSKEFTQLCDEIIARIEEAEGDEWWKDIGPITERLELAHRQLDRPEWPYANEPEWPAFLIVEAHRDHGPIGMANEFATTATKFFEEPYASGNGLKADGVCMLLMRDPIVESYSESMLSYIESGTKRRYVLGEKKDSSIRTLRQWKRAVEQGLFSAPLEAPAESATQQLGKDVFLCHASEDKDSVIRPIVAALNEAGITYWLDEIEVLWGDSLTSKVNEGLRLSRFGVVVLSISFLKKHWPQRELNAVLNLEATTGETKVLPMLIGTAEEQAVILKAFPLLNDKLYVSWNEDASEVVEKLRRRLAT